MSIVKCCQLLFHAIALEDDPLAVDKHPKSALPPLIKPGRKFRLLALTAKGEQYVIHKDRAEPHAQLPYVPLIGIRNNWAFTPAGSETEKRLLARNLATSRYISFALAENASVYSLNDIVYWPEDMNAGSGSSFLLARCNDGHWRGRCGKPGIVPYDQLPKMTIDVDLSVFEDAIPLGYHKTQRGDPPYPAYRMCLVNPADGVTGYCSFTPAGRVDIEHLDEYRLVWLEDIDPPSHQDKTMPNIARYRSWPVSWVNDEQGFVERICIHQPIDGTTSRKEDNFEKPVVCNCVKLGRVMPLKRVHGALTSFPITAPGSPGGPASAIKDQLLLFYEGERLVEPLSAFRPVDIAQWWSFDDISLEESTPLPVMPVASEGRQSRSSTPFDPDAVEAGLEEVRERIGKLRGSPLRYARSVAGGIVNNILRISVWLLIISFVLNVVSKLSDGDYESVWKGMLGYGFLIGLFLLFRPSQKPIGPDAGRGRGLGPRRQGTNASKPGAAYRAGVMRRMAGWLLWNSALGSGVRGKYARRLRELDDLFAKGRLDEALRKAVFLGRERKKGEVKKRAWFGDFPLTGPGIRDNLNIRDRITTGPDYGILTDAGFHALEEMYRRQAENLLEKGDFEHAAFIYAELLDDADAAVRVFERKGDFVTAAKLAQGRRLPPSRFVPLWFKAGDRKRALRLAAQYDAFVDLVTCVNESDPFHKELITAW